MHIQEDVGWVRCACFWGRLGRPYIVSEIGFCMASCSCMYIYNVYNIYYNYVCMYVCITIYICQDGGAVGFVDFTKLLFALSSLAQPLKRVRSIPEHFFVIPSQRKAWEGRFQVETAGTSISS